MAGQARKRVEAFFLSRCDGICVIRRFRNIKVNKLWESIIDHRARLLLENMRRLHFLALCTTLVTARMEPDEAYPANSSEDFYPLLATVLHDLPTCTNLPICRFVERFMADRKPRESVLNPVPDYRSKGETGLEARSYYGGYPISPVSPAIFPAIDTVSVLASLAFLAFLLHSFASLFDRSRSIFPSIIGNRQVSGDRELTDPVKLVLRALDEYDILSNTVALKDQKGSVKTLR